MHMGRASIVTYGFVFFIFHSVIATDKWLYPDRTQTNDFPKWGDVCETGDHQSPVDLNVHNAVDAYFPKMNFQNYDSHITLPSLINNGYTVRLTHFNRQMILSGGPLNGEYIVERVNFHWWSEHTINNVRYPLEAHIIHRNLRYEDLEEASKYDDGIAILGIMFHYSNQENSVIEKIVDNIGFITPVEKINSPFLLQQSFSLRSLFPGSSSGYITYPGSLTTPPCAEAVTWIVLIDTFPVTMEQVEMFRNIETHNGKKLTTNYRDEQELNNRPVQVSRNVREISNIRLRKAGAETFRISKFALLASVLAIVLCK